MMPADCDPACSTPAGRALVDDLVHDRGRHLNALLREAATFCANCPAIDACRTEGQRNREPGVWGGVLRTSKGQVRPLLKPVA